MSDFDGALPASLDAERSILGAILLDEDAFAEAASTLSQRDFALSAHQRIFARMAEMVEAEHAVNIVTLSEELAKRKEVESIGGVAYLAGLTEGLPRRLPIKEYVRIVKEKSQLRDVINGCSAAIERAADQSESLNSILSALQDDMEAIMVGHDEDAWIGADTVAALDKFEHERKLTRATGLGYGIPSLDEFTGGMRNGEVTVVGARSGVGKTSLMCQAAAANCLHGIPVALFSLEMTRDQVRRRLWSIVSGVPYKRITDPWLANIDEAARVREAAAETAEWPLRIYDREDLTLAKILAIAKVCMRRHKTRLICVDYAQEVDAPGKDERAKVMLVCRRLARLVKHEECSLMLLSQLVKTNRESYSKPPIVGDLIESGKLENVAHLILLLHRGWDEERSRIGDEAELIVPKQRRGETGVLRARFNRITATFEEG